jgi:hypothetical protein
MTAQHVPEEGLFCGVQHQPLICDDAVAAFVKRFTFRALRDIRFQNLTPRRSAPRGARRRRGGNAWSPDKTQANDVDTTPSLESARGGWATKQKPQPLGWGFGSRQYVWS